MFRLKSSEASLRFLFHRHPHNNNTTNNNNNPLMAYLLGYYYYDPCSQLSKAPLSSYNRGGGSSYLSLSYLHNLVYANVFGVSRSMGFSVKGCSFDASGGGGDRIMVNAKARPRGFASRPRHPMLVDLEKESSARADGSDATPVNGDNGSLNGSPAKPLCFRDHRLSHKLAVAVDVDEVLGNFVSALNKFIADRYSSEYSVSEYHVYEFFKIWNCSRDEADLRVHEFFKTPYFKSGIHPLPGSQMVLQKLSRYCDLSIVTSRQNVIKEHTIEWIEKNYPGLFHEIHFGNHFALDGVSRPKSEICRSLNAKVLIDDNPRYAMECAESGIRVLLFDYENSYPWSKDDSVDKHPLVTKVKNWEEVEQQLMSLIIS